jgi:hypothetical protein
VIDERLDKFDKSDYFDKMVLSPASWLLLASLTLLVPANGSLIDTIKNAAVKQCDKGLKKDFTVNVDTSKLGVAGTFQHHRKLTIICSLDEPYKTSKCNSFHLSFSLLSLPCV